MAHELNFRANKQLINQKFAKKYTIQTSVFFMDIRALQKTSETISKHVTHDIIITHKTMTWHT